MKPNKTTRWIQTAGEAILIVVLLALCTWGELALKNVSGVNRPYTIFYLVPVAVGAAFLGVRGGMLTAIGAMILARVYLFADNKHGLDLISSPHVDELIEFCALFLGTLAIAVITGQLRTTLGHLHDTNGDLQELNRKLTESEQQRRAFNRDVLLAVTGGKLRLVEPGGMPPPDLTKGPPLLTQPLREPVDASTLRQTLSQIGLQSGMDPERIGDLCTASTEAATNAIKHGNGGLATVWTDSNSVTVQIQDFGSGIAPAHLARATLEQGFSTRVSLGMGFHLMLQSTDALALCTDSHGTVILLQVSNKPRTTLEDTVLARYVGVA